MKNLYNDLASVYESMYQSFINYDEEYEFYSTILKKYNKKNILEIGSGTGNLAKFFIENGFKYRGLDSSKDMIAIAKAKLPTGNFIKGDMRKYGLNEAVEGILMTGRTISYLITDTDVNSAFISIHKNLETGGIFCFDFIDADIFVPEISKRKKITHEASHKGIRYRRNSTWTLKLEHGKDFLWDSTYYKNVKNEWVEIGRDTSAVRTFSVREMKIFLKTYNFQVKNIIERKSYAFPTYVIVAEKI